VLDSCERYIGSVLCVCKRDAGRASFFDATKLLVSDIVCARTENCLRFPRARLRRSPFFCKSNAHRIMIITANAEKSLVSEKELECSHSERLHYTLEMEEKEERAAAAGAPDTA
jgi:hypothetical protein